ncbi:MAG TPA: preprotein translocase subunit SecE [Acidiferrobacterales bacterium]|nr:preprotein translocase subunit SecE [Acidiferrobacterales bacterium]
MFAADRLKLILAVLIVAIGIGAFYYLDTKSDWIRYLILLGALTAAVAVAATTVQGKSAWEFTKEARVELRKVVWPTRKETAQMTLVVIIMVIVVALFLWIVDWGLIKAVQALTGQRF